VCLFIAIYQKKELFNHVLPKHYPSHLATVNVLITNREEVNESARLIKNSDTNIRNNLENVRLSKEKSNIIFAQRAKSYQT